MRTLLAIAAILAHVGCADQSEQSEQPMASTEAGCLVDLIFDSDARRVAFLHDNAATIVDVSSTGEAVLASDATAPALKIFAISSCADFDNSHLGLAIAPDTIARTTDTTLAEVSRSIGGFSSANAPFDENTQIQCVVRISPTPPERSGEVMNVLATSGLRTHLVAGADGGMFGAYAESCDLVRTHVEPAVSQAGVAWPAPFFCANLSLSQCGFSSNIRVGNPD